MKRLVLVCSAITTVVLLASRAEGQDVLDRVRTLYASAAYEDALSALSAVPDANIKSDLELYRVSCLVALGRTAEAQKAVDTLVSSHPAYKPDPAEASPRIQELFKNSRKQLLPGIARRLYAESKAALDRKEGDAAVQGFSEVLRLLDDPDAPQGELVSELRLLASGFLDLSRALPGTAGAAPAGGAPVDAAAAPRKSTILPDTPAQVISQTLPAWQPSVTMGRSFEFHGAVKVSISAEGKVDTAVITDPVEYSYDRLLLRAARTWLYRPAMRNGVPVPSEKTVEITLKPK